MEYKIEKAEKKDLAEILALQKAAFYKVAALHDCFMIRPLHTTLQNIQESFEKYTYIKITWGKRIIASGRAFLKNGKCELENIIVHPEHQRKGFGRMVVTELEKKFHDARVYELFTGKDTTGNVEFYQSLGYSIEDEIEATETEPVLVIMRKKADT